MTRMAQASLAVMLALIVGLAMVGCGDDLYGECTLDADEQCMQRDGEDNNISCVVQPHLECPSGACARYEDSAPFCTTACSDDGDCPNGECRKMVFTDDQSYCVADLHLE